MYKQNNLLSTFIFSSALLSILLVACTKEKTVDTNAPAYKIAMSENLFIPVEIAVPANLPAGNNRVATWFAEGVQKYRSQTKTGGGFEWVFVAPQADLYDASNKKIGTHGAGPYWALSPGDSIFAQHYSPVKTAPSTDNSIDWLLLMPKAGKTPTGLFADVLYIQRIATTGGRAPVVPPTALHETAEVKYTAIYRFTKKNQ